MSADNPSLPVVPANIVGKRDNRCRIGKAAEALRLSQDEVRMIRETSGRIVCPPTRRRDGVWASGTLVSEDVVCTAAHTFITDKGKRFKPLSSCWFETQGTRPQRLALDFSKDGETFLIPKFDPDAIGRFAIDRSCVRLKRRLKQVLPPVIDTPGEAIHRASTLISVSARQLDMRKAAKGCRSSKEPIVQACALRLHSKGVLRNNSLIFGDCDLSPGGSGGPVYARVEGELVLVGMNIAAGKPRADFKPFNFTFFGDNAFSASIAVAFDADFTADLKKLGATGVRIWSEPGPTQ
ncbi:MAG: trypsin-like serine protease [Parvibaculaceae bacterium]